jgi:hypothetical protein
VQLFNNVDDAIRLAKEISTVIIVNGDLWLKSNAQNIDVLLLKLLFKFRYLS